MTTCQHCYEKVFNARTDLDGTKHWIPWGRHPTLFELEDLYCSTVKEGILHTPMPNVHKATNSG